jgi:serine/threonine protein kinase
MSAYTVARTRLGSLAEIEEGYVTKDGAVERRIGSGTFGTVWLVQDPRSKESPLAYKVYHPHDLAIAEKVKRFNIGFKAMSQLEHPHIVKVRKYTECPVGFYMDFIDGPNLRNFTGSLSDPGELIELLLVIADTLYHAHCRGVIHRDVKPENIIMRYNQVNCKWRPYLTDFDLAWFSTATMMTTEALGTVYYAAPEQLAKPGSAAAHAPSTDVYSFGQLCFYVLTQSDPVPLQMADNARALGKRLSDWPAGNAAAAIQEFYKEATQNDPRARMPSFQHVLDRLALVSNMLKASKRPGKLQFNEFCRELTFSVIGLLPEHKYTDSSFCTPSGATRVEIVFVEQSEDKGTIDLRFVASQLVMAGADHKEVRHILNERIKASLHGFPDCQCRRGTQAPFEVFVRVSELQFDWGGITRCHQIITRVVSTMERMP